MHNWDNLRIVLAIRRSGSVAAAARVLGVNYSTINRRLNAYETSLGVSLFEKSPTGQVCTRFGVRICEVAERMEEELAAAERAVIGKDANLEGEIRITMPGNFFHTFLAPEIAAFAKEYPGIRLSFGFTSELTNLSKREADVAFRFSNNPPETLVGLKIANCAKSIYASAEYLADHPESCDRHWIGWKERSRTPEWLLKSSEPNAQIKHHAHNDLAQLHMAAHGMGIAMLSCFVGDPDMRVIRVPPGKTLQGRDLWVLTHEDLRNTARIRALMTFMRGRLKKKTALFRGES